MLKKEMRLFSSLVCCILAFSCSNYQEDDIQDIDNPLNETILQVPVVVHVIHSGNEVGQGDNLSEARVRRQIEILNEDFRRKTGTNGYNEHPDGADSKIEFVLASRTPNGQATNGINRVDTTQTKVDILGYGPNHYAQYGYWDSKSYINIWTTPLPLSTECLALGLSTGPDADLPGVEYLAIPPEGDAEGILINWIHFGESEIDCHARLGRTLTHEMGHYLGLLHPWGARNCEFNDYCDDTPAVIIPVFGNETFMGCDTEVQIENYMNYTHDDVMNMFTKNQVERMRFVLLDDSGRNSLLKSNGIERD